MLSRNFSIAEFVHSETAIKHKIDNLPTPEHLKHIEIVAGEMEKVREILGSTPILFTSGYRNPALNKLVGGVPDSDHALGWAVDFKHRRSVYEVCSAISRANIRFDQLINEFDHWTHISFNPRMRGQMLRAEKVGTSTVYRRGF